MELSLAKANRRCSSAGRRRRGSRARWWFDQMRQVVDEASEWPSAEPEQTGDPTNARTSLAQERPIGRDTQIVPAWPQAREWRVWSMAVFLVVSYPIGSATNIPAQAPGPPAPEK